MRREERQEEEICFTRGESKQPEQPPCIVKLLRKSSVDRPFGFRIIDCLCQAMESL